MFINKTMTKTMELANNGYSTPWNGAVRKQKKQSDSKNHYVFGHKISNIIKPRCECADCGIYRKKLKGQIALKSNIVPRPGLPYKQADFEEALGHSSSKHQRYIGIPSIYGPPRDCVHCNGTGCVHC